MKGFVVGHPRGGTKFMSELLNAEGEHIAGHESLFVLTSRENCLEIFDYYMGMRTNSAVRRILQSFKIVPEILFECDPFIQYALPPIVEEFPEAKFIHMTRDPRAQIPAMYNMGSYAIDIHGRVAGDRSCLIPEYKGYPMVARPSNVQALLPIIKNCNWDSLNRFEKNCVFWRESHRLCLEHLSSRKGKYLLMKLEDISSNDDAVAKVFDFFGLTMPPIDVINRVRGIPANPRYIEKSITDQQLPDRLGEYSTWTEEQKATLKRLCSDISKQIGYEI
jgi:hypothetical protein